MNQNIKNLVKVAISVFFLLFTHGLLADDGGEICSTTFKETDPDKCLTAALDGYGIPKEQKEKAIKWALNNRDHTKGITIKSICGLPSPEIAQLLIDNGVATIDLLKKAFTGDYNNLTRELGEVLIKNHLSPKDIFERMTFHNLPTKDQIEFLLENGLDYTSFLKSILKGYCYTKELVEQRGKLIYWALANGASLSAIKYPAAVAAINKRELFIGQSQYIFYDKYGILNHNYNNDDDPEVAKIVKALNNGLCQFLTEIWLYSKWLQYSQPDKDISTETCLSQELSECRLSTVTPPLYSQEWFDDNLSDLIAWDCYWEDRRWGHWAPPSADKLAKFKNFALAIVANKHPDDNTLVMDNKKFKKKHSVQKSFTLQTLTEFLKDTVNDDELVSIVSDGHYTGFFKHKGNYYYRDPLSSAGEYYDTSLEKTAEEFFSSQPDSTATTLKLDVYAIEI
jgi:hypothetical protein